MRQLEEFDAARLRAVVEGWRHQARRYGEIGETIARVSRDRLSNWDGPASALAKQRVGDLLAGFGDTPDRLSGLADAAEERIDRLVDCRHRLRELLEQAAERHLVVYDNGAAAPQLEPTPDTASPYAPLTPDRWTPYREANELAEKIVDVLSEATRIDESFEQALPAILEGATWAPDNPDALSAQEAAELLRKAAKGDQAALERLKQHRGLFSTGWFATELVTHLGADGVVELPAIMGAHLDDLLDSADPNYAQSARDKQALLRLMADALATATDEGNQTWPSPEQRQRFIDQLTDEGRAEHTVTDDDGETNSYRGYWGLGQIMNAHDGEPPFGTEILTEVGADLRALDQRMQATDPAWPSSAAPFDNDIANSLSPDPTAPGNTSDPMAGLMHAAASNPDAAADLITDSGGNLDPYLLDRPWGDLGSGYGDALEAAAKGDDLESTRLAQEIVNTFGKNLTEDPHFDDRYDGARDSLGRLMAAHIDDVNTSVLRDGPFSRANGFLDVLRFVAQDDAGYKAVVDAELGYTVQQINASIKAGDDAGAISGHINRAATTLGYVTEAREMANLGEAEERDKVNGLLARYAQLGVGMIPFTEKLSGVGQQLADAAITETTGHTLNELLSTDHAVKAEEENASYDQQIRKILNDMTAQVVINNPELIRDGYTIGDYADDDKYHAHPTNTFYDHENQRLRPPEELARNNGVGYDALRYYLEHDPSASGRYHQLLPWDYESGEEEAQDS